MTKKIVFVGPQEVGKSTLRTWLFEGDSLFRLIENPLEPTFGVENFSYDLLQNLGVFDLAGQETDRWFNEEKSIFNDSDIILNILDARHATKIIIDYIKRAIKLQLVQSPTAKIFFLVHKIDLVEASQLKRLKTRLNFLAKEIRKIEKQELQIFYTPIKQDYLYSTISAFIAARAANIFAR